MLGPVSSFPLSALLQDFRLQSSVAEGRTGVPYVDANMRELRATGFMSNRGRQNVASFLTKDLKLDWRMGAEWFESQLVSASGSWDAWLDVIITHMTFCSLFRLKVYVSLEF